MLPDPIGHAFAQADLLRQALTHRSAAGRNNERLEFLGDALVNLIVAEALCERWPRADEGELTRARAALVRESALAAIARGLGLGERLVLGPGEMMSGGHRRDSILADAVEAIAAAVYLDAGFERCRAVVLAWYGDAFDSTRPAAVEKDPKTRLQEWLQARQKPLPEYHLLDATGDEHARSFHVACRLADPPVEAEATGPSRRDAEKLAASRVLESIGLNPA